MRIAFVRPPCAPSKLIPLKRSSIWVVLCAFGALASCTTGADRYCEEAARSNCEFIYTCCNPVERNALGLSSAAHTNLEECIEQTQPQLCADFALFADAEREGRMTSNGDELSAVLNAQKQAVEECDIDAYFGVEVDNKKLFEGAVAEGEECFDARECAATDSQCVRTRAADLVTLAGVCEVAPNEGEACSLFNCAPNLVCQSGLCILRPALGESCSLTACQEGLVCGPGLRCFEQVGNGEACELDVQCFSNVCDANSRTCLGGPPGDAAAYDICEGLPEQ